MLRMLRRFANLCTAFSTGSMMIPSNSCLLLEFSYFPRESVTVTKNSFIAAATSTSLAIISSACVKNILLSESNF